MRRSSAALLVLVLLCVPSLTRVYQQLDHRSTPSTLTSAFSKSAECPPTKTIVDVPPALAFHELIAEPVLTPERAPIVERAPVPSADTAPPDALRAPPLA